MSNVLTNKTAHNPESYAFSVIYVPSAENPTPSGHTDQHKAAAAAAPIIAEPRRRIAQAREAGRRQTDILAERLAERYRTEREKAEITRVVDVVRFVMKEHRHSWADAARHVREADYDIHTAMRLLPGGEAVARMADQIRPNC